MNEQILKLADQADIRWLLEFYPSLETFAELIVEQCAKLCEHESNADEYDQYDMGMQVKAEDIKALIKEHFGVKE